MICKNWAIKNINFFADSIFTYILSPYMLKYQNS